MVSKYFSFRDIWVIIILKKYNRQKQILLIKLRLGVIQGVPYTMLPFRTAGISFVLKLESRYFHNMFHISIGVMC